MISLPSSAPGEEDAQEAVSQAQGERHRRAVTSLVYLVELLSGDLRDLRPEVRGDILARALAAGIAKAYQGADVGHVVRRLRTAADWLEGKASGTAEPPPASHSEAVPVPSPEVVPGALAAVRGRRAA